MFRRFLFFYNKMGNFMHSNDRRQNKVLFTETVRIVPSLSRGTRVEYHAPANRERAGLFTLSKPRVHAEFSALECVEQRKGARWTRRRASSGWVA